jgi:CRISPR-associated protein Cas2
MALRRKSTGGPAVDVLVAYDVDTHDGAGEQRLRKVAHVCEAHGQRVQKSVFECRLTLAQLEILRFRLVSIMDVRRDSVRIYRLPVPRQRMVTTLGVDHYRDPAAPIIL